MLLSLICLVHYSRNALPRGRPVLYSQCVDLLIDAWWKQKNLHSPVVISPAQKEALIRQIAVDFQDVRRERA